MALEGDSPCRGYESAVVHLAVKLLGARSCPVGVRRRVSHRGDEQAEDSAAHYLADAGELHVIGPS